MDWMEQEQERGITITSAATTTFWERTEDGITPETPEAPLQHHRHARPRRLHHRGRALARRARRRGLRARRQRRRGAADRDGVAAGRPLQGSAHRLRQQDGQDRRRLLQLRADDQGPDRRDALPGRSCRSARRTRSRATSTSSPWKSGPGRARIWARPGPASRSATELQDQADEMRSTMIELAVEMDDEAMEAYLEGEEPDVETLRKLIRKGTLGDEVRAGDLRLGLQEQGRAADAERRHRLPAEPARRAGLHGLHARATRPRPATSPARPTTRSRSPASPSRS